MRWLHISDIHNNPDIDGRSTKQLRDKLPSYLQQVVEQFDGRVDEVFVTECFRHALYQKNTEEYAYRFGHEYSDAIWRVNIEKSPKVGLLKFAVGFNLIPEGKETAMQMKDEDFIGRLINWCNRHKSFCLYSTMRKTAKTSSPLFQTSKPAIYF